MSGIAGLVLAAGAGRRLGRPKALVEVGGERLVDRAVRALRQGGAHPVVVVTGAVPVDGLDDVGDLGASVVSNPDWAAGMGSSLRAGLGALSRLGPDVVAAAIVLVDQPGLTSAAVARVLAAAGGSERAITVATYDGRPGHPVVIGRHWWPEVAASAVGDVGARSFLDAHRRDVRPVECADVASDADIDTPEQLRSFGPVSDPSR